MYGGLCMLSGVTTGKYVHTGKGLHIIDSECALTAAHSRSCNAQRAQDLHRVNCCTLHV